LEDALTVALSPDDEALVEQKVRSGEFESREAVVSRALALLRETVNTPVDHLSPAERARRLEAFFEDVDRDLPPRTTPLPDEAFDRSSLYDDRA
jgi:Arc/MetJ-type ribon-helix-helix transcriptional regulator